MSIDIEKIKLILIIIFFSIISFHQITYCQDTFSLLGSWKVDYRECLNLLSEGEREKFNLLPARTIENIELAFSSRTFHFEEEKITIKWKSQNSYFESIGMWRLSGDTVSIKTNGKERFYLIDKSNTNTLVMIQLQNDGGVFSKLALTR